MSRFEGVIPYRLDNYFGGRWQSRFIGRHRFSIRRNVARVGKALAKAPSTLRFAGALQKLNFELRNDFLSGGVATKLVDDGADGRCETSVWR